MNNNLTKFYRREGDKDLKKRNRKLKIGAGLLGAGGIAAGIGVGLALRNKNTIKKVAQNINIPTSQPLKSIEQSPISSKITNTIQSSPDPVYPSSPITPGVKNAEQIKYNKFLNTQKVKARLAKLAEQGKEFKQKSYFRRKDKFNASITRNNYINKEARIIRASGNDVRRQLRARDAFEKNYQRVDTIAEKNRKRLLDLSSAEKIKNTQSNSKIDAKTVQALARRARKQYGANYMYYLSDIANFARKQGSRDKKREIKY